MDRVVTSVPPWGASFPTASSQTGQCPSWAGRCPYRQSPGDGLFHSDSRWPCPPCLLNPVLDPTPLIKPPLALKWEAGLPLSAGGNDLSAPNKCSPALDLPSPPWPWGPSFWEGLTLLPWSRVTSIRFVHCRVNPSPVSILSPLGGSHYPPFT